MQTIIVRYFETVIDPASGREVPNLLELNPTKIFAKHSSPAYPPRAQVRRPPRSSSLSAFLPPSTIVGNWYR